MAVVGQAYVVVRAITDKVEGDIKRGFSGASTSAGRAGRDMGNALTSALGDSFKKNNAFTRLSNQIKTLYPEADRAADSFTSLVRRSFTLQSGFGALVGSIGALVGGLGALVGAAGAAASSVVALGGAFLAVRVGAGVAGFALKGISQAVAAATKTNGGYSKSLQKIKFDAEEAALGVDRAGINLEKAREALARVSDLAPNNRVRREAALAVKEAELALRKAKDAEANPEGAGGADPFAGLTPSQKQFAKFLAGIQPELQKIREAAAKGFLPLLEEQITRLINGGLLDTLEKRFFDIGQGLGIATEKFVDVFLRGNGLNNLNVVLGQIAKNLPALGSTLGALFTSFLTVIRSADPVTRKFISFLESKANTFSDFLETKRLSGELTQFFNSSGAMAARFGTIFGNAFGGLGKIIEANFGPGSGGDILLTYLEKVTAGFENADLIGLEKYFKGAAENFVALGNALGGALEILINSGSNPAIKEFFDILDSAAFAFKQIVDESVKSGPALAALIQSLTEISAVFTDSGQVAAFFGTLNFFANGAAEILKSLKPLIDFAGPAIAVVSAVGLMIGIFTKLSLVALGFIAKGLAGFGIILPGALGKSAAAGGGVAASMTAAAGAMTTASVAMAKLAGTSVPGAAGVTAVGTAAVGTTVATNGLRGALMGLMASNPLGWAVLGVTTVVALATAMAGIPAANLEKAMNGVQKSFEGAADAATVWKQATLAVMDGPGKQVISDVKDLKKNLEILGKVQMGYSGPTTRMAVASTTALASSFGAMGRALANTATTDLPSAQKQLLKFAKETNLSTKEVAIAVDEMDEYKSALKTQAEAMGITIGNTDTMAGKLKLAEFAMGTGEVALRNVAQAQKDFAGKVAESAASMIDFESALTNATKNGIIDADKFVKEMETQFTNAAAFQTNIFALQARGFDSLAAELLAKGPEVAAKAAAALVKKTDTELGKIEGVAEKKGFMTSDAYKKGIESGSLLVTTAAGKLSQGTLLAFTKEFASAKTQSDLDGALARLQAAMQRAGIKIPVGVEVDPTALSNAAKKITGYIGSTFYINGKPASGRKDGGYITKYAMGGFVSGAGTARSDSIPAMLSNGEYVINARATSQNRQLLDAINSNRNVPTGGSTINVTVNPSAQMDEKELALQVSRQIAYSIRKGGY
jgi:hypothetical protein